MAATLLQGLLSLAASLLRLAPLIGAWFAGRASAKASLQAAALDHARQAQAIDEEMARLDDGALRRELLKSRE